MVIASGHSRSKPSPRHLRVASMPTFEPKPKRGAAAASRKLDYVPFPASVVKQIEASWTTELGASAWGGGKTAAMH